MFWKVHFNTEEIQGVEQKNGGEEMETDKDGG